MRRTTRLIAAVAVAAAVLVAVPLALAHDSRWLIHSGGGQGRVTNHHWLTVCDNSVDGHNVWIRYHTNLDQPANYTTSTNPAPSGGCHREGSTYGQFVAWYQVCISWEGCTGRREHATW